MIEDVIALLGLGILGQSTPHVSKSLDFRE